MLPAADIAEIISSLASLKLEPATTAAVLSAVLAPLLRSSSSDPPAGLSPSNKPSRRAQAKPRTAPRQRRTAAAPAPDSPRQRAIVALKANRDKSLTKIAVIANVSRSTVCNAYRELEAEARKQARKEARQARATPKPAAKEPNEARARAVCFLREELARGPKTVSDVEAAAGKAHIDEQLLGQARRDLGVVASRGNAGGVQAVQWSLPAS